MTAFGALAAIHLPDSSEPVPHGILERLENAERSHARQLKGFRQVNWTGGRLALKKARGMIGAKPEAVLTGARGEPLIGKPWSGSVAHKKTMAVGLLGRHKAGTVGVDLERIDGRIREGIGHRILRPEEAERLEGLPEDQRWILILLHFSLKEAIYKALHPHLNRYVAFDEASLTLRVDGSASVKLHLKEPAPYPLKLELSYLWLVQHVVTIARVGTRSRGRRRSGSNRTRGQGANTQGDAHPQAGKSQGDPSH